MNAWYALLLAAIIAVAGWQPQRTQDSTEELLREFATDLDQSRAHCSAPMAGSGC